MNFKPGDRVRVVRTRDTERRQIADRVATVRYCSLHFVTLLVDGIEHTIGLVFVEPMEAPR